jgi:RNA polymerase sigma factor (TIGR02999 family)
MSHHMVKAKELTELLSKLSDDDSDAQHAVFELVYKDLRHLAKRFLRSERRDHTLQPTALVHEAYLRLFQQSRVKLENRIHFFAMASRAMRHVLVDHARGLRAVKRAGVKVSLDFAAVATPEQSADLLALDRALERLATWDPRQAQIVEMRFFGGLSIEEVAAVLNVSQRTVKRNWTLARAWLYGELTKTYEGRRVGKA